MEGIDEFLNQRQKDNLLRVLNPFNNKNQGILNTKEGKFIDFSSNDYLGLSQHPRLKNALQQAAERFGVGATASRLLSGDFFVHHELEERTARFKGTEAALVFNSGYQANVGIISAFCRRGDVIFSDKLNHASIIDGILLSGARLFRFNHNDCEHLKLQLQRQRHKFRRSLIISETVFSMDGDTPALKELVGLKEKYNCQLMVDEAHATGIFADNGAGLVREYGLTEQVDLIMGTFSKALGSFGAYLACSARIKDYLINTCRSFIYSTALPPAIICSNLASLDLVEKEPQRRKTLLDNAAYFRKSLSQQGFAVSGSSQIVPLLVGESGKAVAMSKALLKKGYWVLPVRPPTVSRGQARLRFSLTYHHTKPILDKLIGDICAINHEQLV